MSRTRSSVRRLGPVIAAAALLLAGCGYDTASQDLCTQYDQLKTSADDLKAVDPANGTVDQLRAEADRVQAQLDQLQAVSEGRLDTAITNLRTAVTDFKEAVVDAGQKARETAAPDVKDALKQVSTSYAELKQALDTECSAG